MELPEKLYFKFSGCDYSVFHKGKGIDIATIHKNKKTYDKIKSYKFVISLTNIYPIYHENYDENNNIDIKIEFECSCNLYKYLKITEIKYDGVIEKYFKIDYESLLNDIIPEEFNKIISIDNIEKMKQVSENHPVTFLYVFR